MARDGSQCVGISPNRVPVGNSDIQIWCTPADGASHKAGSAQSSGLYLNAQSLSMAGEIAAICGL